MASGSVAYKKRPANYANAVIAGSLDNYYSSTEQTLQEQDRHNSHIYDGLICNDNGDQDNTYEETTIQTTHSGSRDSPRAPTRDNSATAMATINARQPNADITPKAQTRNTTSNEKVFVKKRKHVVIGALFTLVMLVLVLAGSIVATKIALQSLDEVETLKTMITSQKEEIEALKADTRNSSENIIEMHNEIEAARARASDYSDAQSNISTELRDLKMKLERVVIFEAYGQYGYNSSLVEYEEVIKLTEVKENEGNTYDSTTGFFIAPVSGLYIFHAEFCMDQGEDLNLQVCVDYCSGVTSIAHEYHVNDTTNPYFCFTTVYSHKLVRGQWVYLRNLRKDGMDGTYITFSGILLREI